MSCFERILYVFCLYTVFIGSSDLDRWPTFGGSATSIYLKMGLAVKVIQSGFSLVIYHRNQCISHKQKVCTFKNWIKIGIKQLNSSLPIHAIGDIFRCIRSRTIGWSTIYILTLAYELCKYQSGAVSRVADSNVGFCWVETRRCHLFFFHANYLFKSMFPIISFWILARFLPFYQL